MQTLTDETAGTLLRDAKRTLEENILRNVKAFEAQSGLFVDSLELVRLNNEMGEPAGTVGIRVHLVL